MLVEGKGDGRGEVSGVVVVLTGGRRAVGGGKVVRLQDGDASNLQHGAVGVSTSTAPIAVDHVGGLNELVVLGRGQDAVAIHLGQVVLVHPLSSGEQSSSQLGASDGSLAGGDDLDAGTTRQVGVEVGCGTSRFRDHRGDVLVEAIRQGVAHLSGVGAPNVPMVLGFVDVGDEHIGDELVIDLDDSFSVLHCGTRQHGAGGVVRSGVQTHDWEAGALAGADGANGVKGLEDGGLTERGENFTGPDLKKQGVVAGPGATTCSVNKA